MRVGRGGKAGGAKGASGAGGASKAGAAQGAFGAKVDKAESLVGPSGGIGWRSDQGVRFPETTWPGRPSTPAPPTP